MPKYSYRSKQSKEYIHTIQAKNKEQAIEFFAKIKVLEIDKFNKLYEVIER
jgi:hypothetical protein